MWSSKYFGITSSFIFTLFILAGCAHVHTPTKLVETYPGDARLDLTAKLVITDELRHAEIRDDFGADIMVLDLGNNLASNIKNVVNAVFDQVITDSDGQMANAATPDVVITPRLVLAKASYAQWKWETGSVSLGLEWEMTDGTGKLLWVDTVKGEASTNAWDYADPIVTQMDLAIEQLFTNSYKSLQDNPVLRNLQHQ